MSFCAHSWKQLRTVCTSLLVFALIWTGIGTVGYASPASSTTQYTRSLEQLIKSPSLVVRGVDGRNGFGFDLRADQDVQKLTLDLTLTQSPALLDALSHVNILLNDRFVKTIALDRTAASHPRQVQVELPTQQLAPYNIVELQLIGHYSTDCEDPRHPDLWVRVEPSSQLIFEVSQRVLADDLGQLPRPFFDAGDLHAQPLTFVLGTPSDKRLEAAGIVSSWLGALAAYRGSDFSVSPQGLPQRGHAIVILAARETLPGVVLPPVQGPTVAMRSNPHNPSSKLLIITGRDDDEIHRAAIGLALGGQALSGTDARITDVQVQARQPYDAPNWIPTHRPVRLGELLPVRDLSVTGYDAPPIRVPLQLPPDLSHWKTPTVPLQLRYRYTPLEKDEASKLSIFINQQFMDKFKLGVSLDGLWGALTNIPGVTDQTINLPLTYFSGQNQVDFKFTYPNPSRPECSGVYMNPRHSSLDPDSSIDFSGLPHHLAMPDLAAFRNAGFPFSRMADLSETVIVLPQQAQHFEFTTLLNVLGKIGQLTGYPAIGVTVQRSAANLNDKDILIIEAGLPSPLLTQWATHLPTPQTSKDQSWFTSLFQRFNSRAGAGTLAFDIPSDAIYVSGFESPVSAGRSVVVINSQRASNLPNNTQTLLFNETQAVHVQGRLVAVRAEQITTLSTEKTYYAGNLGVLQHTLWFLSRHPTLLVLILLISTLVIAIVLYLSLRTRAQGRLMINVPPTSPNNHKE